MKIKLIVALAALLITVPMALAGFGNGSNLTGFTRDRPSRFNQSVAATSCTATDGGSCDLSPGSIGSLAGSGPYSSVLVEPGAVIVFACACSSTSAATDCAPTGVTNDVEISDQTNGATNMRMSLSYLVVGGVNMTETITCTGSGGAADGTVGVLKGYFPGDPVTNILDATRTLSNANTTDPDPASITSVTDGTRIVPFCASANTDAAITTPSGYSNVTTNTANDTGVDVTIAMADKLSQIRTGENPGTFSTWVTGQWVCSTIALRGWQ